MKILLVSLLCFVAMSLTAQTEKPGYCDESVNTYGSVVGVDNNTTTPDALPSFASLPTTEYKVQVAILRYTDPKEYPFHSALVARYRPCEEVWVVESRESFANKDAAQKLQSELKQVGYSSAFITELVGYQ